MTENELAALAANERFYRALENSDLVAMEALWLHENTVKCFHPSREFSVGWEAVRQSWIHTFAGKRRLRITPVEITITVADGFANIGCLEQIAVFAHPDAAPLAVTTNATNLFQCINGEWRMIHHHASLMRDLKILPEEKE